MKNYCITCKKKIDKLDFFVQTAKGRICSSCLVQQEQPCKEIKGLFKPSTQKSKQLEKFKKLSSLELRVGLY